MRCALPEVLRCTALASLLLGCGSSDDATADAETSAGTDDGTPTATGTQPADPSAGSGDDDTSGSACGNGVVDDGEQCDDGPANSDFEPDACRTDCRTARCYDGVVDPSAGEECDDGSDNGSEPDACRADCTAPRCGDGVQDSGEACDDGNAAWGDTCYACSNLWYFVLDESDAGPTILRSTRDGQPQTLVAADGSTAGLRRIVLDGGGARLFGLQSSGDVDRVIVFDPETGVQQVAFGIDEAALGFDPELQAMAHGDDGLLWIGAGGSGATRLVSLDPDSGEVTIAGELASGLDVADMAADDASQLYLTTGDAGTVLRVALPLLAIDTIADLTRPLGVTYDPVQQELWVVDNPPGGPARLLRGQGGVLAPFSSAANDVDPEARAIDIDVGGVALVTQRAYGRVVAVQAFDAIEVFFTEPLQAPIDLAILDMDR